MKSPIRFAVLVIALSTAALSAACATSSSAQHVLRVEYTSEPDAEGNVESGVVFWRRNSIVGKEIPKDLLDKLGSTFPVMLDLDGKLANTCFVTDSMFGITLLERGKSKLGGQLWFTADAGWSVDFSLLPGGKVRGQTGYYHAGGKSDDSTKVSGSYREVADFSECYEKVRAQPDDPPVKAAN